MGEREDKRKHELDQAIRKEQEKRRAIREKRRRQERRKKIIVAISAILILSMISCIVISNINNKKNEKNDKDNNIITTENITSRQLVEEPATPIEPQVVFEKKEVKLIAVGDDLVHTGVWKSFEQEDGSHDYTKLFAGIQSYIDDADIKVINQETIFGGEGTELSSYPVFNSPEEIGDAIAKVGFNVVLHATNHAFDMGESGMLNSINFWKTKHPEVTMLGLNETAEDKNDIPLLEVNGITFALLNYTYSHNWESLSSVAEEHLNTLCDYDPDSRMLDFNKINPQVLEDIKRAEDLADFTIVFPHWGTEYVFGTTEQQDNFSMMMVEAGADLIVGGHPHVIEPVKWIETDNGNRALCYYSLGNFVSTQDSIGGILGGMAKLTIIQDENGTYIDEDSIQAIPLVTDYLYPGYTGGALINGTYVLGEYTEEQAAAHGLLPRFGIRVTRDELLRISEEMFGEYLSLE